jgi:preprotein translocase subunit SecG
MLSTLLIIHTCVAVALVILILLQKTDPSSGGMFGGAGGGSHTVVRNPLARPTAILAAVFMVLSLVLAVLGKGGGSQQGSVMVEAALPVAPSPAALQSGILPAMPTVITTSATQGVSPATVVTPSSVSPSQG